MCVCFNVLSVKSIHRLRKLLDWTIDRFSNAQSNDLSAVSLGKTCCVYLDKIIQHKGTSEDLGIGPGRVSI